MAIGCIFILQTFGVGAMAPNPVAEFDPMEPFAKEDVLRGVLDELEKFDYKLYGPIPLRFHRGRPTKYEFDLNLGLVHFTEQRLRGVRRNRPKDECEVGDSDDVLRPSLQGEGEGHDPQPPRSPMAPLEID